LCPRSPLNYFRNGTTIAVTKAKLILFDTLASIRSDRTPAYNVLIK
jgi:hypothetical protein